MSWPFRYQYRFGAQPTERFDCSENQRWVSIDCIPRNVIDQVGFEDHGFASNVDREQAKACGEDLIKRLRILLCMEDRNSRSVRSLIEMILGQKKRSRDRRASRESRAANKKVPTGEAHYSTPKADKARE
jgi:hypothetical protein